MIYMTADLHLGHRNILEYCQRPFSSIEDMNEALIDNWNEVVEEQDTVYILGDFALGKIAETLPLVSLLSGEKILVVGNHDRSFRGNSKKTGDWEQKYLDAGFAKLIHTQPTELVLVGRYRIDHFPYPGGGDSKQVERYRECRPIDYGHRLLHGHIHNTRRREGKMLNVGVDVNAFRPISLAQIDQEFENE